MSGRKDHIRIKFDPDSVQTFTLTEEEQAAAFEQVWKMLGYSSAEEYRKAAKEAEKLWCKCGNPSEETTFYEDGEGELCVKHHYICDDCGLIWQVG